MTKEPSQARRYREMIRADLKLLLRQIPADAYGSDADLRSLLENLYNENKNQLTQLLKEKAPESVITTQKAGLFVLSCGLFTFGRLDVAEDILTGIPGGKGSIRRLAWVINVLLPIPKHFDALAHPEAVREWLKVNYSRLKWDDYSEQYIWNTSVECQ
ncbi:hypothetical protein [Oscillatoria sp. HE19RPO]|jgi:hypothetical protein|uniref:hypothetical protein n=1 Tax=Oscillatoria sp. HE19RPO TaxID=2954806 RepID=UPI0020C3B6FA|nr:hypothetical protein [Oscillatoria sp. HE19RPO]